MSNYVRSVIDTELNFETIILHNENLGWCYAFLVLDGF